MNDQDCGDVALAARKLGFHTINRSTGGKFRFDWWDKNKPFILECPEADDEKEAFRQSCIALVSYIAVPGAINNQHNADSIV